MTTIGFIGLGHMGAPTVRKLHAARHDVRGFDMSAANCAVARAAGIEVGTSAAGAATRADVVITMLPAGHDVTDVYRGITASPGCIAPPPARCSSTPPPSRSKKPAACMIGPSRQGTASSMHRCRRGAVRADAPDAVLREQGGRRLGNPRRHPGDPCPEHHPIPGGAPMTDYTTILVEQRGRGAAQGRTSRFRQPRWCPVGRHLLR